MFENFRRDLKRLAERIENTFRLLDSLQGEVTGTVDIYSKVNEKLRSDIDKLYLTLQQCYDECLNYLESRGIDIHTIEKIPNDYRDAVEIIINPFWRTFQQSVNKTLKQYAVYLPNLDQDSVEELQTSIQMTTSDLLNIFDGMLKSVSKGTDTDE